jgi:NAD(P)-dependent dehydrogenase (short-subunit alcohol dehydrogenase family)
MGSADGGEPVNLHGIFLCCRAVVPAMKQQRYGKIVNISSGTV